MKALGLATTVLYKPTDSHSYLSHPFHVKNSILYSQFLRLRVVYAATAILISFRSPMRCVNSLHWERGYPSSIVTSALEHVYNIDRETALKPTEPKTEERTPLTLTYHPNNLQVKNIILRNFKLLQTDSETASIFKEPPLVSFKRNKSLRNSLVKGFYGSDLQPGTFRCSHKRCATPALSLKALLQFAAPLHLYQRDLLHKLCLLEQALRRRNRTCRRSFSRASTGRKK